MQKWLIASVDKKVLKINLEIAWTQHFAFYRTDATFAEFVEAILYFMNKDHIYLQPHFPEIAESN